MRSESSPTNRTRPALEIVHAAKRIVNLTIGAGVKRIHGEIAPARIPGPVAAERYGGVASIGFDIVAKRRYFEGDAMDDERHGSVGDTGGYRS